MYIERTQNKTFFLHPLLIGRINGKQKHILDNIASASKVGFNRVKVICKSYPVANKLVKSPLFNSNNLVTHVPAYYVQ